MRFKLGLAGKYFLILFTVIILLFLLLTWLNFRETQEILRRQILNESALVVEKSNQYLDLYTENIGNLLLYVSNELYITSDRLREYADATPLVAETIYYRNEVGEIVCSRPAFLEVFGDLLPFASPSYPDPSPAISWSEPYYSPISGKTVSFTQKIRAGTVMVETDLDILGTKIIELIRREGQTVVVTSPTGNSILFDEYDPLYPIVEQRYPLEIIEAFRYELIGPAKAAGSINWEGKTHYVVSSDDNRLNWLITVLVDPQVFSPELRALYINFIQVGALLFTLLLIASVIVSLIFTRPVRRLSRVMDNVESLHTLEPIPNNYGNELGDLVVSYNSMMRRINKLTYEKNDFEWRMLQSQIGPHFLYNTLACVNALAKRNQTMEIGETVNSLINLLKYSVDRSAEEVTLLDEMEMLNAYLIIQNTRYGDLFSLVDQIPANLKMSQVPALLLQPLVENAIFHGLAPKGNKGTISVSARSAGQDLELAITDDGEGIDQETLAAIGSMLQSGGEIDGDSRLHSRDRLNSIGIINIQERLRVHYGAEYGLEIISDEGEGTTVLIRLPLNQAEKTNTGTF